MGRLLVADAPATLHLVELAALVAVPLRACLGLVGLAGHCLSRLSRYLSYVVGCDDEHRDCHEPYRDPREGYEAVHCVVEVLGCSGPLLVDHVGELQHEEGGDEDRDDGSGDERT